MSTSLPAQIKRESVETIKSLAQKMINDEINLIQGCREISRLRFNTKSSEDDMFNTFILVASDTDYVPLSENVRKNFSEEYLSKIDKEQKEYLKDMKKEIFKACSILIKKLS